MDDVAIDALIEAVDANSNGKINYSEFMVAGMNRTKFITEERIDACFELIDRVIIFWLTFRTVPEKFRWMTSRLC